MGQPIRLAPFQRRFILDVYDNPKRTRKAILSIARKNAKTATIACLVLAHVAGPEARLNSEIVSGARSREQAALVFRYASKMVRMSPKLSGLVRIVPSQKKLAGLAANVEYHAISAEAGTAHGLSPVVAIIDEPGQVRGSRDDFIDAIVTSQGAHEDPLLIYIGTQAPTDADLFSLLIDDALAGADPRTICHLYAAEPGADVLDESAWRAANPALGLFRSEDDVRELAGQAHRMPSAESSFRNLILNQRVTADSLFISRNVWTTNGDGPAELDPSLPVFGGLDLSSRADMTALVLIQKQGGVWQAWPHLWAPSDGITDRARRDRAPYDTWASKGLLRLTRGASVDYEDVVRDIGEIIAGLNVEAIAFDRWRIDVLQKELDRAGLAIPLLPHGQGYKDMSPALDAIEADLLNGKFAHGMHPILTMCASNAVAVSDPAGNRKLDKARSTGRIDALVALVMARRAADDAEEKRRSVYETRGVIEIDY